MIEYCLLLAVFLLLYIAECAVYVPAGSIAFRLSSNPNRRIALLSKLRTQPRPGIVFAIPFSVRSDVIVCCPFPLSLSPTGITTVSRFENGGANAEFIAFEDMLRIEGAQNKLLVNSSVVATNCSEIQAMEIVALLKRIKKLPVAKRILEIEKVFSQRFDPRGVGKRLRQFTENTYDLGLDSLMLLIVILAISPIVVWRWGLVASWPFILAYLIFNALLVAWDFRRANRELFSENGMSRWSSITMMLLSPPAAARATKYLARDIGHGYHPLAFAASRCSDMEFRKLASWVLRQSMFGSDNNEGLDNRCEESMRWFRLELQRHIVTLIQEHGDNPEEIITPGKRESEQVKSYCPCCLTQFVISDGVCSDCGGLSLRPFA